MRLVRLSFVLVTLFAPLAAIHNSFEVKLSAQAPGSDALVAAYGFNEGTGTTVADASGNLHTGTIAGAAWSTAGRYGGALSFDGSGDWVTISDSPSLDLSSGMTIQAWVFPTVVSGWRTVVLKETTGGLAYALYAHDNAPRPAAYVNVGSGDVAAIGSTQLPLNTWTHLAATFNGTTLSFYVNSALAGSSTVNGSIRSSSNPLRIGGNSVWGEYFTGRIDEVRIHNRALTQSEIQALMSTPVSEQLGFEVVAYNDTLTLGQSDSGTYNLLISPLGGFTGTVLTSISGLPPGSSGAFTPPDNVPHPGPFALDVTTGAATPPGTYQLTVTATSGSLSATKTLALNVTNNPDFRIVVEPNSLTVTQGQNGVANFELQPMNGYSQLLTLGATGLPSSVSAAFAPSASLAPPGSGTVEFTVGALTPPGLYPLFITAADGVRTRQAAFTLTVAQGGTGGSWRQQALGGTPAKFYGVIVGDVGNTGQNRVYASGGLGAMYEYSYSSTSWTFSQMPVGVTADAEMHNMAIGPGRGDGINRLYIAVSGGDKVYECSWVNGKWQIALVANLAGATDIIIGNGRNDGRTRMYISWMSGTTEFTWTGSVWQQVTMSSNEGGWVHGIDLGPGRDDGINRIYTANQGDGGVYEYSWNGSSWTKLLLGSTSDSRNIEVAQGHNDGRFRVYVPSGDSNIYEFTWTGSTWQNVSMGNAGAGGVKVHSIPAKTKSDDLVRIYGASSDGGVDEYTWTVSAWQTVRLGEATAYMYGLAAGDGLNKGTTQIYGSSYDGNAYLFEWIPVGPPPPITVPNVVGLAQGAAQTQITAAGLTVGTVTNQPSTTLAIGTVINQSPLGGTQAPPGSSVSLFVSAGVVVPDVVSQTELDATTDITSAGLALGTLSNATSTIVEAGRVISQNPVAGLHVSGGTAVDLVVSSGPPLLVTVPDVRGLAQGAGQSQITAAGLTVGTVTNQASATVPLGVIIDQSPAGTLQAPQGSAVNLIVSSGVAVPNVVNQLQLGATATITGAGLTVGTVSNAPSATVGAGRVISQNPVAGTRVSSGAAVDLVVSSGPPPVSLAVDRVVLSDGRGTRATPSFSTSSAGEVLLAFVASDGPSSGSSQSVTVSGAGLTWIRVRRTNTQRGDSEIWTATATSRLSNVTVRSIQSAGGYYQSLTVVTFTGAAGVGASAGASAASGAPIVSLTTTKVGSVVYAVGNDWDNAIARTVPANQTMVHQYLAPVGDTLWVQRLANAVNAPGVVQVNDTAPTTDRWNLAAVEIRPK